jgi:hypothetical protein
MEKKGPNRFAGGYLVKVSLDMGPTSFDSDELMTCFGIKEEGLCKNRSDFRLVALDSAGKTARGKNVEPSVGVSLLCRTCAIKAAREVLDEIEGLRGTNVPTLGFMLLPMHIEASLAEQLRVNVTPEVWTDPKNRRLT